MSIPIVDLAKFSHGNESERIEFVYELGRAYEDVGFVAVKNHGIPEELIDKLYIYVQQLFALPIVVKESFQIPGLAGQRGYTSFGSEHAKGSDAPDLKEFFQFGQTATTTNNNPDLDHPPNVQVPQIPAFYSTMLAAYQYFEQSGSKLLQAIAIYLGLDKDYFTPYITNGNSILRAIHYPPITVEPQSAIRAEQHEDINLITLLVGASAEGLQIFSKQEEWVAVTALPGQIVVNVGDMLQRLTNDRLKSTTHRVINPPKEQWSTSRFSIPFFLHPVSSMSLACLEDCVDIDHPKAYPDATAGAYFDERLQEIGLKK